MSASTRPPVPLVRDGAPALPLAPERPAPRSAFTAAVAGRQWLVVPLIGAILSRVWSLALLALAAHDRHTALFGPGSVTAKWDATWYVAIAADGYHAAPLHLNPLGGQHDYAFFPLWPLVIHVVSFLPISPSILAAILSPVLFCVAAVLIAVALEPAFGRAAAIDAVLLLAFSPAAFTFSMGYSEALFLVLAAAAFISTSPGHRAVAVGLAVVARIAGAPLIAVDGLRWLISRGRDLGALAVAIVGSLAFAAWWVAVAVISGDPTGFMKGSPDWAFVSGVPAVLHAIDRPEAPGIGALVIVGVVAIGAVLALRRSWPLGTYALLSLALGLLPGGLVSSMPRYALAAFPAYAGLASAGGRRLTVVLLVVSAVAQAWLVSLSFPSVGHGIPP